VVRPATANAVEHRVRGGGGGGGEGEGEGGGGTRTGVATAVHASCRVYLTTVVHRLEGVNKGPACRRPCAAACAPL
jgi:hypothetical protein